MEGLGLKSSVPDQLARELISALSDPRFRYFELITTAFDHTAHHNNDRETLLNVLKELDAMLGQIWTAIQKSPLASETALIVMTDQFFKTVDARRPEWQQNLDELNQELAVLRLRIQQQRESCAVQSKKFTKEDGDAGRDDEAKRVCAWADIWIGQEENYGEYGRI